MRTRAIKEVEDYRKEYSNRIEMTYSGGNNGHPNWPEYLTKLSKVVEKLVKKYGSDNVVVANIKNDVVDDVFYAKVIVYRDAYKNIKF